MKGGVDNVICIRTPLTVEFFKHWVKFLYPFHGLTEREQDIAACFLFHRYELAKVISDNNILDSVLMSEDTKKKVMEDCGVKQQMLAVIISKLRKANVIIEGNKFNPRFIPSVKEENGNFKLMLLFDFINNA